MVLKAPSEPSGSQELQARLAAPGPHGTHPPSHSHSACSLACTHACTLRRRIAIPALACSSALHSYLHARACAAAALQSAAPALACSFSPPVARSPWLLYFGPKTDFACTHARSVDALQFLRSHAPQPYATICLLARARVRRRRTAAPALACSFSPPMARFIIMKPVLQERPSHLLYVR